MKKKIIVSKINWEGGACPYQLEGETDNGESVYVRYRAGNLRIEVNNICVYQKVIGEDQNDEEVIAQYKKAGMDEESIKRFEESFKMLRQFSDDGKLCFDGYLTLDELRQETEGEFEWPDLQ